MYRSKTRNSVRDSLHDLASVSAYLGHRDPDVSYLFAKFILRSNSQFYMKQL